MYEKFTVEVDKACGDGIYRSYSINFTGRLLKTIQDGHTTVRLYEWVDRGYVVYLVHVEEDKARRPPRGTLYPFINTHSSWKMNSQKFSSRIRRLAYPFLEDSHLSHKTITELSRQIRGAGRRKGGGHDTGDRHVLRWYAHRLLA